MPSTIVNMQTLRSYQSDLRSNATPWEKAFKSRLETAGVVFGFQEIIAPYIVDFVFPEQMLVVELDGKHHESNAEYDQRRSNYLGRLGFDVWRIPNAEADNFRIELITGHQRRMSVDFYDAISRAQRRYSSGIPKLRVVPVKKDYKKRTPCARPCGSCGNTFIEKRNGQLQSHRVKGNKWCDGGAIPKVKPTATCPICVEPRKLRQNGRCGRCQKVLSLVKKNPETLRRILRFVEI